MNGLFWAALLLAMANHASHAATFQLGIGKALNNTNGALPGYVGSATITANHLTVSYLRMGKSQVGENAALSSFGYSGGRDRYSYSLSLITGASYSAAVWWDSKHPQNSCGVEGCGKRYANDGRHYSRACHLCGGVIGAQYNPSRHTFIRLDYFGIRHMSPTFQGLVATMGLTF